MAANSVPSTLPYDWLDQILCIFHDSQIFSMTLWAISNTMSDILNQVQLDTNS
jgi:hypothetical protein